jgi:thiol-disulfide isomerase/thioredoxin
LPPDEKPRIRRQMKENTDPQGPRRGPVRRSFGIFAAAILIGAAAGLAGIYGIGGFERNAGADAACRPALAAATRIAPLARGEVAAVAAAEKPLSVAALSFQDAQGRVRTLSEWSGRTVLLNLWATWCVPCRKEMPALAALEKMRGGDGFEVVAVNIDTRDPDKPRAWLKDNDVNGLAYYADPSARIFQDLKAVGKAFGMPTTMLVDPHGCEIATIAGPAEWASEDAVRLIDAALRP